MGADLLLSKLDRVRQTGAGRWQARCPAHDDKGPSLAVRELEDGRVLLHCFAGCPAHGVLSAIGLDMGALFPETQQMQHGKPERRPFPAADILRCVAFEALVVLAAATAMLAGEPMSAVDRSRLSLASARLQAALDAGGLHHA